MSELTLESGSQPAGAGASTAELIARRLDTRGLSCPMPIVRTTPGDGRALARAAARGHRVQPKSVSEYQSWSRLTGNPLVESSIEGGTYRFVLRKR